LNMKKNNVIFIFFLLVISCSKGPHRSPLIISELVKNSEIPNPLARQIASDSKACFKDTFDVETLKAEVKELEKRFESGSKPDGQWRHLDFATLPNAQGNFLKTFGKQIGDIKNPESIDYSSCRDVICIINKVYGKDDYVAGYVHYLWYLKFEHYLAATNTIHDARSAPGIYNGKPMPLSSYLYNDEELYAWWRTSHLIKNPFVKLTNLKIIYRVPRGELFEQEVERLNKIKKENEERKAQGLAPLPLPTNLACGIAYQSGYISMQDECLRINHDLDSGSFYLSVVHELGHQLDYQEGKRIKEAYRSHQEDYLKASGFFLTEKKDNQGKTIRQWEHIPDIKLVTSYSGTNPQENFAETISYYQLKTETKNLIHSKHYSWISEKVFSSNHFDYVAIVKKWQNEHADHMSKSMMRITDDCLKNRFFTPSDYFSSEDLNLSLDPQTLNCLGQKTLQARNEIEKVIKKTSPMGCNIINDRNQSHIWRDSFKDFAKRKYNMIFSNLNLFRGSLEQLSNIKEDESDERMVYEYYLDCYEHVNIKSCIEKKMQNFYFQKMSHLNIPAANAGPMASLLVFDVDIREVEVEVHSYFKSFIDSNQTEITKAAFDLFYDCTQGKVDNDSIPTGESFLLADGYLASSVYNCVNLGHSDVVSKLLKELEVNGIGLTHPGEVAIAKHYLVPKFNEQLLEIYINNKSLEFKKSMSFKVSFGGTVRDLLLSDLSWVTNTLDEESIKGECHQQSRRIFEKNFRPAYHKVMELFSDQIESSCSNIHQAQKFIEFNSKNKSSQHTDIKLKLEHKLLELANLRAKDCIKLYPMATEIERLKHKKSREECLLNSWESVETEALRAVADAPADYLFTHRRRLQITVIQSNF
jgi:hypothetical protein